MLVAWVMMSGVINFWGPRENRDLGPYFHMNMGTLTPKPTQTLDHRPAASPHPISYPYIHGKQVTGSTITYEIWGPRSWDPHFNMSPVFHTRDHMCCHHE